MESNTKIVVVTDKAPAAVGPYSAGIVVGNLVFTSGQLPIDPSTGTMSNEISEQAKQSMKNVLAVLGAAGCSSSDIIKTTIFLKDMNDFATINSVYAEFFEKDFPARSAVEVARLPKDAMVEIEAIALKK